MRSDSQRLICLSIWCNRIEQHAQINTFSAQAVIVQEAGIIALIERGIRVLTSSGDNLTETSDPFKIAMRQIASVFAQLEKARLVSKLKAARDRKRAAVVKVEGPEMLCRD
ncbi:hypothetical protein [Bradyrhizobium sp.]|uniref:hypothetical protein n=1 Tax=Bradyrhizobium sp. TaxID=376 RepID=UPI0025C31401|nr:hypothetical protein [Bradyrhizobium sp.]